MNQPSIMPMPGPGVTGGPSAGPVELSGGAFTGRFCLALAALAVGESRIENLPPEPGTLALIEGLRALGARIAAPASGLWIVHGLGIGGVGETAAVLDTGTEEQVFTLLAALLAGREGFGVVSAALPGERPALLDALTRLGARARASAGRITPLAIAGARDPRPLEIGHEGAAPLLRQAAILMALTARGQSRLSGALAHADGSEACLTPFGVTWHLTESQLLIEGQPELRPVQLRLTR